MKRHVLTFDIPVHAYDFNAEIFESGGIRFQNLSKIEKIIFTSSFLNKDHIQIIFKLWNATFTSITYPIKEARVIYCKIVKKFSCSKSLVEDDSIII